MNSPREPSSPAPVSLYVHIPFCRFKCYYCDFNTYAGIEGLIPSYVDALSAEVRRWGEAIQRSDTAVDVPTVFFGGGTPSLLAPAQMESLLAAIREAFTIRPDAEITMEVNPESVTTDAIRAFRSLGVNRFSMGAQSTDDAELRMLGRLHDSRRQRAAFNELRRAGAQNVNLDFIYGLPGQSRETWGRSLTAALGMAPEHLSLYALTVEESTPFYGWVQEGRLPEPDPDAAADMYEDAQALLTAAGYAQYEISNWAKPGHACRHNLIYWRNLPFIGVGPGAHSYLFGARFAVMRQPREYIRRMAELSGAGPPPGAPAMESRVDGVDILRTIAPIETVDPYSDEMERAETLVLGLRLNEGVREEDYARRFGTAPSALFPDAITDSVRDGLLESGEGVLRLTDRGRLLSNEVFVRIMG